MSYSPVKPGASLLIAWQIKGRNVLIVGGGKVAAGRLLHILNAEGKVTLVAPRHGLSDEVEYRIDANQVHKYIDREFVPADLDGMDMVLSAIDDPIASTEIWQLCKLQRIPVNVADVPSECDFYFGSQHRDGPLQIMISTSGQAPRLTSIIRRVIAKCLPANTGTAITQVGTLRVRLRQRAPDPSQGVKRMEW
jgi:precorrin-2 dehydrogenase/sirohydrochlorin ferrochelatase